MPNEPQKNGEVVTEKKIVGESKQEQKTTPVEGSYETSGDSLYAKVKVSELFYWHNLQIYPQGMQRINVY